MNRDFKILRQGILDLTAETVQEFPAMLGNKSGVVKVSGNIVNILTIPEGIPMTVINRTSYNRPGTVVMVGKKKGSNSLEVLYGVNDNSSVPLSDDNVISSLPQHGFTHTYPSYDTAWIRNMQFLPLLCLPVSGYVVRVFPGTIAKKASTGYVHCPGDTSLDLSGDVPVSGACWELIQVDDDGTLSTVTGSTEADRTTLTGSNIPTATTTPIWAIILDSTYAFLEASNSRNDFWDLRFAVTLPNLGAKYEHIMYMDSVGGGWEFLDIDDGAGHQEPLFMDADVY